MPQGSRRSPGDGPPAPALGNRGLRLGRASTKKLFNKIRHPELVEGSASSGRSKEPKRKSSDLSGHSCESPEKPRSPEEKSLLLLNGSRCRFALRPFNHLRAQNLPDRAPDRIRQLVQVRADRRTSIKRLRATFIADAKFERNGSTVHRIQQVRTSP